MIVTSTKTASCTLPPSQKNPDPTCTITPTLVTAAALSTGASASATGAAKARRNLYDRAVPLDREARVAERKARREASNKLQRRAPDAATTTVTEQNTVRHLCNAKSIMRFADLPIVTLHHRHFDHHRPCHYSYLDL